MTPAEKYHYDPGTLETLERLSVPFAVYQFLDKRVVTLVLSDGFCRLFGYEDRTQAYYDMDHDMYKDAHPDDVARIANEAYRFATEGGRYEALYRTRTKDRSEYRIIHAYGEHVFTDTGVRLAHVWYSDEGIYNAECGQEGIGLNESLSNALYGNSLVKASQYDYLTGLPSMSYFFELALAGKKRTLENGGTPALIYMDFIGMKFYNSKYGFAEGDKLLQSFAKILSKLFGNEHCCRFASDHFAVYAETAGLDDRLQQTISECRELNEGKTLPVHIGVYVSQNENIHTSVVLDRAKLACSALKGRYESAVQYYSRDMSKDADDKQYIIENIDRAVAENWIQVYLQPIVRSVNGKTCDVEALARWIDPNKGFLSPAEFIPALEDAGLIWKLDLCMVDRVLEAIKTQMADGYVIIPHSINLSRADFDACDIVEEIRKRVDAAGVPRDRITIEITESVIGSDPAFMKEQVERFRKDGFPVWMDDFGSGYSSLDILQSFHFDLIKFDMSFMREFNQGENAKIVLTELMRMATSLGLDTVCEGVETAEQVRFLQEIGCSKLQGFWFSKPIPFDTIREMFRDKKLIPNENPEESEYYENIGRISLYDLDLITGDEADSFHNVFSTIPMAILEVTGRTIRYIRSNPSYREFVRRFFNKDLSDLQIGLDAPVVEYVNGFFRVVRQCCEGRNRIYFDERMPDGSTAHSFVRRLSVNPVTGSVAVAVAVLSISEPDDSMTYADIAESLAADYYNIFLIDLDTNDYIEYTRQPDSEEMSLKRHGEDFFESARRDTMTRIWQEDRERFLSLFTKENVLRTIDEQGIFTTVYRLIDTGTPVYVNMKVTRMHGSNRLILGVSVVDAPMRQKVRYEDLQKERDTLIRVMALSDGYVALYTVDLQTEHFTEFSASEDVDSLGVAKEGDDFFRQSFVNAESYCYAEDLQRFREQFTRENVLQGIREDGRFSISYRLMIHGKPKQVTLKAVLLKNGNTDKLLIGVRAWKDRK
jgi:diguanylate cyclase (GGDEF)-like protein